MDKEKEYPFPINPELIEKYGEEGLKQLTEYREIKKNKLYSLWEEQPSDDVKERGFREHAESLRERGDPYLEPVLIGSDMLLFHTWDINFEKPIRPFGDDEGLEHFDEPYEHPNTEVANFINRISNLYLKNEQVRNIFSHKLNLSAKEIRFTGDLLSLSKLVPKERLLSKDLNIPELLSYIQDNADLRRTLGNAITRAQIADQYFIDHASIKKLDKRIENHSINSSDPVLMDDKLAVALTKNLLSEDNLIIQTQGNPQGGQLVMIMDFEDTILKDIPTDQISSELNKSSRSKSESKRGFFQTADGQVEQSKGSQLLYKKLEHSFQQEQHKSNFPFEEFLLASLSRSKLKDFLKGHTTNMSRDECQEYEDTLNEMVVSMIRNIISKPQTIIIKDQFIQYINHLGQGVSFAIKKDSEETNIELLGFIDSQSIMVIPDLEKEREEYTRRKEERLYSGKLGFDNLEKNLINEIDW